MLGFLLRGFFLHGFLVAAALTQTFTDRLWCIIVIEQLSFEAEERGIVAKYVGASKSCNAEGTTSKSLAPSWLLQLFHQE